MDSLKYNVVSFYVVLRAGVKYTKLGKLATVKRLKSIHFYS